MGNMDCTVEKEVLAIPVEDQTPAVECIEQEQRSAQKVLESPTQIQDTDQEDTTDMDMEEEHKQPEEEIGEKKGEEEEKEERMEEGKEDEEKKEQPAADK